MLQPGDQIDVWVVERALGSGGMGSVYRCHNRGAKRILAAIKVLESAFRKHPEAEARFVREAEILFGIDHPNIVKVRNVRTEGEVAFLEMEFVEGESLEDRLDSGPQPLGAGLELLAQLADALAYLHERGIRHRDVKPANLLIRPDGQIKLVDFGLAVEADHTRITREGTTFGTVSYAPPEWIDPERLDPVKWDLYALGVVAFEVLTGEVAFPVSGLGSARQQAMQVILNKQQTGPLDLGPEAPAGVRAIVRALTQTDPDDRPDSAADVRDQLRALAAELPDERACLPVSGQSGRPPSATWSLPAQTPPPAPRTPAPAEPTAPEPAAITPRASRRIPVLATGGALAALLALIVISASIAVWWSWPDDPPARPVSLGFTATTLDPSWTATVVLRGERRAGPASQPLRFPEAEPGPTDVRWVVGADCPADDCLCDPSTADCATTPPCPQTCATGASTVERTPGEGVQRITLTLPDPSGSAHVALADGGAAEATFRLGDQRRTGTEARFRDLPPGEHVVALSAGECEDAAPDCARDASCPVGCSAARQSLTVPWTGEVRATVELPEPEAPAARPSPAARRPPSRITHARFAAWLDAKPAFHADAARSSGLADEHYLSGWSGLSPPAGAAQRPMVHVSYAAAAAYCRGRGGLAALEAQPHTWSDSGGVAYEWRSADGRPAWRQADGTTSLRVDPSSSNIFTGFRCAR